MSSERQSTLALSLNELEFINPDAYLNASNSTSLRDFDYWHSRATNNASYTENLIQEEYRRQYPNYDRVTQMHSSSTEVTPGMNGGSVQSLISSAIPEIDPQKESEFLILVQSILNRFDFFENEQKLNLIKVFGFTINAAGLSTHHPDLVEHVSHFREIKFPNIADLHRYVGSRTKADEARKLFKNIAAEYFLG